MNIAHDLTVVVRLPIYLTNMWVTFAIPIANKCSQQASQLFLSLFTKIGFRYTKKNAALPRIHYVERKLTEQVNSVRSDGLSFATVSLQGRQDGDDDGDRDDDETEPRLSRAWILVRIAVCVEITPKFQRDREPDGAEVLARTARVGHRVLCRLRLRQFPRPVLLVVPSVHSLVRCGQSNGRRASRPWREHQHTRCPVRGAVTVYLHIHNDTTALLTDCMKLYWI